MTVMPGLIDVHCHMTYGESAAEEEIDLYTSHELRTLVAAANAEKVLRAGVTSISQPGGSYYIGVGLREGIKRGLVHGPRMSTAGRYLTTSNGLTDWYPTSVGVPEGSIGVLTNTVDEMKTEIRKQVKNGVDLIKLADSPYGQYQAFTDDELKCVAELTAPAREEVHDSRPGRRRARCRRPGGVRLDHARQRHDRRGRRSAGADPGSRSCRHCCCSPTCATGPSSPGHGRGT